jgi:hypothetical protein
VRLSRWHGRKAPQQCPQPCVLQFATLGVDAMLQRLDPMEHQQHTALHQGFGNGLAFSSRTCRISLDVEFIERPVQERFGRGRALLAALAVEGPSEHSLGATIAVGLHPLEPLVDQCRFPGSAFGNKREDVGLTICPRLIEALQLGIAADEAFIGGLGQPRDLDEPRARGAAARDVVGRVTGISGAMLCSSFDNGADFSCQIGHHLVARTGFVEFQRDPIGGSQIEIEQPRRDAEVG